MEVVYSNELYNVVANPYDNQYLIVNKVTNVVEARESAKPTALFKADALVGAMEQFNKSRG